ncbi:MFS transporter, partial [Sulfurospirillum arsenophilum]|uniref:MFS transporter n=1 Tax=Sulfurospirillum arsenophilum TaxID=56698 RepID=UPI0005A9C0C9
EVLRNKLAFLEVYNISFGGAIANVASDIIIVVFMIMVGFILVTGFKNSNSLFDAKISKWLYLVIFCFGVCLIKLSGPSEFLYFRF